MTPTLLLAVHGTRDPNGTSVAQALAREVAEDAGVPVRLGFADVCHPDVGQVAATIEGPIVVVPAFLAAGYHVHVDIPAQLARTGRTAVPLARARPDTLQDPRAAIITGALGEDDRLITTAAHRLHHAGWRPADAVVLAAAGSSDPRALAHVGTAARRLAAALATPAPVEAAYIATAAPTVPETVARLRRRGHTRVAIASWLLAPGLFHQRLAHAGADAVADPLCPEDGIAEVITARYRAAAALQPARA
ncbi:sirohydrochlorin ferrochelatase [Lipingzhangella halophila]|uniref:Sirohydrochlorin ferrochelatase n=1 Tax=Lipingzhangella halophila TaxID=1783352 RepID=A0A7W7W2N4_9ACTN|nr:CbiX/SirB N-terminal domain-containing protein [Lipingzhangella halophila]MBB4931951.1 sirohydrochlorin ferrochelatase [Lipingzhangella halophila]